MTIICLFLTDFRIFLLEDFSGKFAVKWISTILPHLAYVATLPYETLTKLRKVYFAESANENIFKIGEYLAKLQART